MYALLASFSTEIQ